MATKSTQTLKSDITTADLLNGLRSAASPEYQSLMPKADINDINTLFSIGAAFRDFPNLKNEFFPTLINRIGVVTITSKRYKNPYSFAYRGKIEFGTTAEEIYVSIAKPFEYDQEVAESEYFKRVKSDVQTAFHTLNYQKMYKATTTEQEFQQAFLSWDGVKRLIDGIITSLYSAMEYDEFQVTLYTIARAIYEGRTYTVSIEEGTNTEETTKNLITAVRTFATTLPFYSTKYNEAGVRNYTDRDSLYTFIAAPVEAAADVNVLAAAFNMDKAEFIGRRATVPNFGALDQARLAELFAQESNYTPIPDEVLQTLEKTVDVVMVDENWFQFYDYFTRFDRVENKQGLYWNNFLHAWRVFSTSPFSNIITIMRNNEPTVTAVEVSPSSMTTAKGNSFILTATVTSTGFPKQSVTWESSTEFLKITQLTGNTCRVDVSDSATEDTYTITAKSVFDTTKTGTCSVTVSTGG